MTPTELLPCPFCGSADRLKIEADDVSAWVACAGCIAQGPMYDERDDAIRFWNLRAHGALPGEGWRVVPSEVTEEMLRAWWEQPSFSSGYRAMLAVAPNPPTAEVGDE